MASNSKNVVVLIKHATTLMQQYQSTRSREKLNEAIKTFRRAVELSKNWPKEDKSYFLPRFNLVVALSHAQDGNEMGEASIRRYGEIVTMTHELIHITDESHPQRSDFHQKLGCNYMLLYRACKKKTDLDLAIENQTRARGFPLIEPDKSDFLNQLVFMHATRYTDFGKADEDLDALIPLMRERLNSRAKLGNEHARYTSDLANYYQLRHERRGLLVDLENAIQFQIEAISYARSSSTKRRYWDVLVCLYMVRSTHPAISVTDIKPTVVALKRAQLKALDLSVIIGDESAGTRASRLSDLRKSYIALSYC